jgi:hypothetical protein
VSGRESACVRASVCVWCECVCVSVRFDCLGVSDMPGPWPREWAGADGGCGRGCGWQTQVVVVVVVVAGLKVIGEAARRGEHEHGKVGWAGRPYSINSMTRMSGTIDRFPQLETRQAGRSE